MYSNIAFRPESTRKTPKYQTTSKVNQYILRYNIPLELYLTTLKTQENIFKTVPCNENPIIQKYSYHVTPF